MGIHSMFNKKVAEERCNAEKNKPQIKEVHPQSTPEELTERRSLTEAMQGDGPAEEGENNVPQEGN